jgi:hemolysin activation/secretion protein
LVLKNNKRYVLAALAVSLSFSFAAQAVSPSQVPASARPDTLQRTFGAESLEPTTGTPQTLPSEPKVQNSQPGSQAAGIKFKMTRVVIEGNTVYSYEQLLPLFAKKINTVITVSDLFKIVEDITNFYRNNGYILTRAILPPQHVEDGTVIIRVIEGFIQNVAVIGSPKGAKKLVAAYGKNISSERPLRVQTMENYLLLANEIPGTTVRAVLAPSKSTVGASDLNLATYNKIMTGYFSYDNYGTRYVGPQEDTLSLAANSIFRPGDTTLMTYGTTPKGRELRYFDLNHNTPISSDGLRWIFGGNSSKTRPLYTLRQLQINGDARTYYTSLQYPVYRSQAASVTFNAAFNYFDSQVQTILNALLYRDHTRPVQLGINATTVDSWRGNNLLSFNVKKGLNFLGATSNTSSSATTSRPGGTADFTKLNYQISRLQPLFWRLSAFGVTQGQYTFNPLLSSEQFGFGGSQLGRGYDTAEIIGDRGISGSAEVRMDFFPGQILLQTLELYYYYDAGVVWNIKSNPGVNMKSSATSTGIGARFSLLKYLFGNIMITQPLTKQVAALELIGNGRRPRIFFSITAQYN